MRFPGCLKVATSIVCATLVLSILTGTTLAQTEDNLGDGDADPVKLFERGQSAHARGELVKALALYEEAIKVRPEFPEAAFQQGVVLVSLGRLADAEASYRKAIELKPNWSLPYSALGALLVRTNRDSDASPILQQALQLDSRDNVALRVLADIRLRTGDSNGALKLAQTATLDPDAPASAWILRAMAERATSRIVLSALRIIKLDSRTAVITPMMPPVVTTLSLILKLAIVSCNCLCRFC